MTRRIVLSLTAVAVIATGAGVASAATTSSKASVPAHQLCLLLYRDNPSQPQHICVNW